MAIDEGSFNGDYGNDWNVLMQRQQREQETAQDAGIERLGQQTMVDFDDLVARDNAAQAEATNRRNATLGALMIQARNNKGFVPKAILGEASQRMGVPVAGGNYDENGNFVLYSMSQGPDGQAQFSPLAVASPAQQLLVLQRAKMGPDMRREIYGVLRGRNSADTLAKYGIEDPDAPVATGPAVTMGGGTAQRLGASILGPEKRGGSMFYTNGKGYTLRSYSGPETGFQPVMESNDAGAQWKVLSVGPDPNDPSGQRQVRRYENSETGEVISVPDGSSIESVVRGTSEKERIAAMNNASREAIQRDKSDTRRDLAEAANVLKKYGIDVSAAIKERGLDLAEASGAAKGAARQGYNKDEYAALEKMRDAIKYEEDDDGNKAERKLDDEQKARLARIEARMDAMLGIGADQTQDGSGAQTRRFTDAQREEARRILAQRRAASRETNGGKHDTKLSAEEEAEYQRWRANLPKALQYEGDYDLRGYWKDPETRKDGIVDGQHFTDKYKKPNHKTFSVESKYAVGEDAKKAGRWESDGSFSPAGASNGADRGSERAIAGMKTAEDKRKEMAERGKDETSWRQKQIRLYNEESSRRRDEIADEMRLRGEAEGWPQWRIDEETKKAQSEENDRLQKKYQLRRKAGTGELY